MESDKIVLKIRLSSKFGACADGNSENGAGNVFPANYKECSLGLANSYSSVLTNKFIMEISASVKILHGHFLRSYSCIRFNQLCCSFTLLNQTQNLKSVVLCLSFSLLVVRRIWRK